MDSARDLASLLELEAGPERTAGVAAWFQSLYQGRSGVPILVGGAAAELYTGGAYTSGDLDFVGEVPKAVARRLQEAGFTKQGRHWVHEAGEIFLELPGSALEPHEQVDELRFGAWTILALSPEDVLVDRLAAWHFWSSQADGFTALLLRCSKTTPFDAKRLRMAAAARQVLPALERLEDYVRKLGDGQPTPEGFERWVKSNA